MFTRQTEELLQKSLDSLPQLAGSRSLRHDIDDLVAMALPPSKLAIVDDMATSQVLGDKVFQALKGRFAPVHITLEGRIDASAEAAEEVRQRSQGCDAYIAVGSGTINDICKHVSFQDSKPYIVFPTAASMNGYLSANASISSNGYKQT